MAAIANARLMSACCGLIASFVSAHAACRQDEQQFVVGAHFVNRGRPLADLGFPLVVCNLAPNQDVRVTSILWMGDTYYASRLEFHVADDELDTARLAPTRGSYAGIHPDGYLWSMRPDLDPPAALQRLANRDPRMLVVGVESEKGQHAFGQFELNFGLAYRRGVETDGLHGLLFHPMQQPGGRDVVLLLPDTQRPTVDDRMASLLASRGHVVLELNVARDGLPAQREPLPIEYFSRAVDFLRREYAGPNGRIDVVAFGRATEAAAMLALTRADIARIILVSPSSVINAGEGRGLPTDRPAWTLRGEPLAFVHRVADEDEALARQRPPYTTRPLYDLRLAGATDDDRARIPFDRITSDIVLIACDQDAVWPADRMAQDIRDLARRRGHANVAAYILPGCGHDLVAPIAPTTRREFVAQDGVRFALGGAPQAVWYGQRAAWDIIRRAVGEGDR